MKDYPSNERHQKADTRQKFYQQAAPPSGLVPHIACIILNWNGWQDTVDCLDALQHCTYSSFSVIVVDNGSTDDSVARIRTAHRHILLLQSRENLGFAGGNNIGIRHALVHGADYVWLLNNDTQPAPEALSALVAKALTDSRIGAVASICYYAEAPATVQVWAGTRVNLWIGTAVNTSEPRDDDWFHALYGASLLLSRAALDDVGLLDQGFFLYWEETEFCLRLRKRGWRLAAASASHVLHKVNASIGGNKVVMDRYSTASALRVLRLHSPAPHLASFLFLVARFGRRISRLEFTRCKSVWAGVRDYCRSLPVVPAIR